MRDLVLVASFLLKTIDFIGKYKDYNTPTKTITQKVLLLDFDADKISE